MPNLGMVYGTNAIFMVILSGDFGDGLRKKRWLSKITIDGFLLKWGIPSRHHGFQYEVVQWSNAKYQPQMNSSGLLMRVGLPH